MTRFNLTRSEFDLSAEFFKLLVLQAQYRNPNNLDAVLTDMIENGTAHPILAKAADVGLWSDQMRPWLGMTGAQRAEQFRAVQKATIAIGSTADSVLAGPLVAISTLVQAFFRSLRNVSMTDAILEYAMPTPPNSKFAVSTSAATAAQGNEAQWISMSSFAVTGEQTHPSRVDALVAVSEDLLRMGAAQAQNFLAAEMSSSIVKAADLVTAGILTASISPSASSGHPRDDLRKALESVDLGQFSRPMVFVSPAMLAQMATLGESGTVHSGPPSFPDIQLPNGGTVAGMPIFGIDALGSYTGLGSPSGDFMVVVDAAQCGGDVGIVVPASSAQTSLQMASGIGVTSPADEPTASTMVSLYQSNAIAMRLTRWFTMLRARSTAVAVVGPCSYGI